MSAQNSSENHQPGEEDPGPIIRLLLAIRGSFIYSVVALGVIFLILGVLNALLGLVRPLMSGMFFMWGISAILYGLGGIVGLRMIGYS